MNSSMVLLNSAMTQLMRRIRHVDDAQGVGRARLSVLAVLHFGGPCTPSALAAQEMVSRATMHHVLKGLEADGCVRRSADRKDRRAHVVRLTPRGRALIRKAHAARIEFLESLASGMDAASVEVAARVLGALRDNARAREG